jgi:hypothetical protein
MTASDDSPIPAKARRSDLGGRTHRPSAVTGPTASSWARAGGTRTAPASPWRSAARTVEATVWLRGRVRRPGQLGPEVAA